MNLEVKIPSDTPQKTVKKTRVNKTPLSLLEQEKAIQDMLIAKCEAIKNIEKRLIKTLNSAERGARGYMEYGVCLSASDDIKLAAYLKAVIKVHKLTGEDLDFVCDLKRVGLQLNPLACCLMMRGLKSAKVLVSLGVNVNGVEQTEGLPPVYFLARMGTPEANDLTIELLKKGADAMIKCHVNGDCASRSTNSNTPPKGGVFEWWIFNNATEVVITALEVSKDDGKCSHFLSKGFERLRRGEQEKQKWFAFVEQSVIQTLINKAPAQIIMDPQSVEVCVPVSIHAPQKMRI